jgi:Zn finger protein HypA/HybF involved in hydrogenase expression
MHELSIARAILDTARARTPPGTRLTRVNVVAGPLQAIDPLALSWAWESVTLGLAMSPSVVVLTTTPWRLQCEACGQTFESDSIDAGCVCGSARSHPVGGDQLILETLEVEPIDVPDDRGERFAQEVSGAGSNR